MTVGELVAALRTYDPTCNVVAEVNGFEWKAVQRINPPLPNPEDDVQAAVCLVTGGSL